MGFTTLWELVSQDPWYVPRPYRTMGGMWTVDTWRRGLVTAQLMDEGWTQRIMAPGLEVVRSGSRKAVFVQGDESHLERLIQELQING